MNSLVWDHDAGGKRLWDIVGDVLSLANDSEDSHLERSEFRYTSDSPAAYSLVLHLLIIKKQLHLEGLNRKGGG